LLLEDVAVGVRKDGEKLYKVAFVVVVVVVVASAAAVSVPVVINLNI
jgi:hypothetical protein